MIYRIEPGTHENSITAYQRFERQSFLSESHRIWMQAMRHPVAAGILALMFGLGFIGWIATYLA